MDQSRWYYRKSKSGCEVLSYKEETVEAGTFMAYTIKYTGKTTNSRGYDADETEIGCM
ncbi:MAG: hypothetical protein R2879_04580 [Saprospiraceae bacterium]